MGNCCHKEENDSKTRIITPLYAARPEMFDPDEPHPNAKYANNSIRTTKYNCFTFIFLNLYEQLHRFANIYFIFIICLNFIPRISAFAKEAAPAPVVFVLLVTMIKDGYEDFRRWRSDKRINHTLCSVYSIEAQDYVPEEWQHIRPGDFVRLKSGTVIPADILLIHSSDKAGITYVETANLDGESSLKQREVIKGYVNETFDISQFTHPVEVEEPNKEIYKFAGKLHADEVIPLRKENIILRGCILRNTDYVIGMVIYAGRETKAMLNNKGPRFKRSKLERQINKDIIWCVVMLIILCFTGSLGNYIWLKSFPSQNVIFLVPQNQSTISPENTLEFEAFIKFWTFIIIYQAMIPLPLYVTIEFIKMGHLGFMSNDLALYDEETNKPIEVKAFNITEDLGQIQYIFADKTGTLTDNKMEFRRCTIGSIDYEDDPNEGLSETSISSDTPIIHQDALTNCGDAPEPHQANGRAHTNSHTNSTHDETKPKKKTPPGVEELSKIRPIIEAATLRQSVARPSTDNPDSQRITEFAILMALCNTAVVSKSKNEVEPLNASMNKKKRKKGGKRDTNTKDKKSIIGSFTATLGIKKTKTHIEPMPNPSASGVQSRFFLPPISSDIPSGPPMSELSIEEMLQGRNNPAYDNDGDPSDLPRLTGTYSTYPDLSQVDTESLGGASGITSSSFDPRGCPYSDAELLTSYECESPDEMALVKTACRYGCKLLQRGPDFVSLWMPAEGIHTFKVLNVLTFDANRKRMSVIVRHPYTNKIIIYTKGADSHMLPLIKKDTNEATIMASQTKTSMHTYARLGLRTLVMGMRVLDEAEYAAWARKWTNCVYISDEEISTLASELEKDLTLLGSTGIEDKLQTGVPETIQNLRKAGINIWMLTGDKQETAIQIAYSANLISLQQVVILVNASKKSDLKNLLKNRLAEINDKFPAEIEIRQRRRRPPTRENLALCIDGETLALALDEEIQFDFLLLAEQCSSVICSRCTPYQKSEVVALVKTHLRMQTLAIGDGANDVNMIQTADVGIGISGQEGMQAVMASDFALSKFFYLERLLLVHGNINYDRLARTCLFMFYKDTILVMVMFWYQLFNGFSATIQLDQLFALLFNVTLTSLPPLVYGMWEKHLLPDTLLKNPILYREGINCQSYLPHYFWLNVLDAFWQSTVIFFIPYILWVDTDMGIWSFGDVQTTTLIITIFVHLGIESCHFTFFHWLSSIGTLLVAWYIFAIIYNNIVETLSPEQSYWVIMMLFQNPTYWLSIFVTVALAVLPRLMSRAVINSLFPSMSSQARQLERIYGVGVELPIYKSQTVYPRESEMHTSHNKVQPKRPSSAPNRPKHTNSGNNSAINSPQQTRNSIFFCGGRASPTPSDTDDNKTLYTSIPLPEVNDSSRTPRSATGRPTSRQNGIDRRSRHSRSRSEGRGVLEAVQKGQAEERWRKEMEAKTEVSFGRGPPTPTPVAMDDPPAYHPPPRPVLQLNPSMLMDMPQPTQPPSPTTVLDDAPSYNQVQDTKFTDEKNPKSLADNGRYERKNSQPRQELKDFGHENRLYNELKTFEGKEDEDSWSAKPIGNLPALPGYHPPPRPFSEAHIGPGQGIPSLAVNVAEASDSGSDIDDHLTSVPLAVIKPSDMHSSPPPSYDSTLYNDTNC